ncbi:LppU/SCO3897 family protein [Streptomyces sp. NRRL F-5053]|uniref:LppU/SCO3897 family protein n=1 Tax=Streptomyces sp. NRRL F-5053 TaxID=1463854 RepID=UPI0004CB622B|nr:hypothetical protein [Streptomyces sp. NRRL F-5053]
MAQQKVRRGGGWFRRRRAARDETAPGDGPARDDSAVGGAAHGPEASGPPDAPDAPDVAEVPDPDTPEERARRGRWRLVVAGALFATLILPRVVSTAGQAGATDAGPSPAPSATGASARPGPSGSPTGLPGPSASAPPTAPAPGSPGALPAPPAGAPGSADSGAGAFRSVRAGQCLSVHDNGSGWSRPAPTAATRVDCGSEHAYVRVTAVREETGTCPAGNGRAEWRRGGTTLCLTRQFRTDQCLLAESDGSGVRAALMSAPACSQRAPAQGRFDRLLTVTGLHDLPASPRVCREDAGADGHARYWTWEVDGGERLLCAAEVGASDR